jgi:hypothetical protein
MSHISLSQSLISKLLLRHLGWKMLALCAALVVSVALWQLGIAQPARFLPRPAEPVSSSAIVKSPAAADSAHEAKPKARYDLALIAADSTYYQRADASRLYDKAPIPAGRKRHEELLIMREAIRLVLPERWLEQPLVVRAKPNRPVTFLALDSGKFSNGEITITVKADAQGLASAAFFVGNQGRYRVLAASPENAGPAAFELHCMSKTLRDDLRSGRYAEQYLAEQKANEKRQAAAAAELAERIRQRRLVK